MEMKQYTMYDPETGVIIQNGMCSDEEFTTLVSNPPEGTEIIEGTGTVVYHKIVNGVITEKTAEELKEYFDALEIAQLGNDSPNPIIWQSEQTMLLNMLNSGKWYTVLDDDFPSDGGKVDLSATVSVSNPDANEVTVSLMLVGWCLPFGGVYVSESYALTTSDTSFDISITGLIRKLQVFEWCASNISVLIFWETAVVGASLKVSKTVLTAVETKI